MSFARDGLFVSRQVHVMKWPDWFRRRPAPSLGTITARVQQGADGDVIIDVRGQTCPGYLLAINRAVEKLPPATRARLWITYPPCGEDVQAWCDARGLVLEGMETGEAMTVMTVYKP